MMKQLISAALVVSFLVVLGAAHVRSTTPATLTVSLQRIATQSNAGKRANQQLEALRQERGRELLVKQKELADVAQQLAKGAMPVAERERLTQDENRRRNEFQQLTAKAQSDFQAEQQRLQAEIRAQLSPILAEIASRHGVDVVLNSDTAVAWAAAGSDMTDEVVQRLNAEAK